MTESTGPHGVRASDAERELYAAKVRQAVGEGRLSLAEGDERLAAIYATRFREELSPMIRDLPLPGRGGGPGGAERGVGFGGAPGSYGPGSDGPGSGGAGSYGPGSYGPGSGGPGSYGLGWRGGRGARGGPWGRRGPWDRGSAWDQGGASDQGGLWDGSADDESGGKPGWHGHGPWGRLALLRHAAFVAVVAAVLIGIWAITASHFFWPAIPLIFLTLGLARHARWRAYAVRR